MLHHCNEFQKSRKYLCMRQDVLFKLFHPGAMQQGSLKCGFNQQTSGWVWDETSGCYNKNNTNVHLSGLVISFVMRCKQADVSRWPADCAGLAAITKVLFLVSEVHLRQTNGSPCKAACLKTWDKAQSMLKLFCDMMVILYWYLCGNQFKRF